MDRINRVLWQNDSVYRCFSKQNIAVGSRTVFIKRLVGLEVLDLNVAQVFRSLKEKFLFVFGEKFVMRSLGFFKLKGSSLVFKKKKNNNLKLEFDMPYYYQLSDDGLREFEDFFYRILFWRFLSKYLRKKYRLQTGFILKSTIFGFEILVVNPVFLVEYLNFEASVAVLDKLRFESKNEFLRIKITCVNKWVRAALKELINEAA